MHYYSLFGKEKYFQIFNNSKLDYKLKGDLLYRTHKLVNMNDSLLIFDNDSVIKLSQLKCIKIRGTRISHWLFVSGILFFMIDTGNNIVNGHTKIVNEQTVLISSVGIIAGLIVKRLQDKHIYIRKNTVLKVLDTNYENLNAASH
ncbi:MAG: hypothetical protein V4677_11015 [Bacteroidota bacterium]